LLAGIERVEAPPPLNPFAKTPREAKPEKQQENAVMGKPSGVKPAWADQKMPNVAPM
jgi:hypothetical protein